MNLPDVYRELAKRQPEMMSLPGKLPFFPYPQITSWVVGYVFAFMLVPHMVMRAYSAASDQVLRVTALGWIPIACFGHFLTATVLGLSAAVLLPVLPKGVAFDAITPYIAFTLSPMPYIVGPVLMMGLFCASVSTAGAALLTMSTIITKDFLIETFNMKLSEGKTRYVSRIVVVLLGASAIVLAYAPKNMIAVIMTASLGLVAVFVVPYTFGLFWKRFNTPGAVSGMIVGLVVLIWLTYIPVLGGGAGPQGFSLLKFQPLFWTILIQLVVSVIVTVLTPEPRKEIIERHFKKTDGSTC
jgi:Na+/proline symporter